MRRLAPALALMVCGGCASSPDGALSLYSMQTPTDSNKVIDCLNNPGR